MGREDREKLKRRPVPHADHKKAAQPSEPAKEDSSEPYDGADDDDDVQPPKWPAPDVDDD